jgi:hypothetical protein
MSLYQTVLGEAFSQLAPTLQAFHLQPGQLWQGVADVYWTPNPLLRTLLRLTPLPREGQRVALSFRLTRTDSYECWDRRFAGQRAASRQWAEGDHIVELFGPGRIRLAQTVVDGALEQWSCGVRVFGVPLPWACAPDIRARQWAVGPAQHFDVHMRLFGKTVLRYTGHLLPES